MPTAKRTIEEARTINRTGLKTLDRMAQDPRITKIWQEGNDGYWADIAEGFNWDGLSGLHEDTAAALVEKLGMIEEGAPY